MGIGNVDPTLLIHKTAEELKKIQTVQPPQWAAFVRTGTSKQRPPVQLDWWYIRSASILRKLFVLGPVGTSKLRTKYGAKKNRGMRPEKFFPGSGNHIRKILQQLEKAGLAKQVEKDTHKGRVVTPAGQKLLEAVASQILKEQGVTLPEKPKVKLEADKPKKKKVVKKRARKTTKRKTAKKEEAAESAPKEEKAVKAPVEQEEKVEAPAEVKAEEKSE